MSESVPKSRTRRIAVRFLTLMLFGCLAVAGFAAGVLLYPAPPPTRSQQETLKKIELLGALRADWFHSGGTFSETEARRAARGESAVHILLLGVDRRKNERGRSDAIHVLRLEPGRVTLISLPRDTKIALRGDSAPQKLNHAYSFGGTALAIRTIEDLLKIQIDGHLEIDLQNFVSVARLAKNVTLNGKLIGAESIFEHLDGLLSWLRNRSLPGGDIRRMQRHQLFIAKSLDWLLTLYKEHPAAFEASVIGSLKLSETDIRPEQVMVLCQIYSQAESATETQATPHLRNAATASMERFILPGRTLLVHSLTGEVVPIDVSVDSSAEADTRTARKDPVARLNHAVAEILATDSSILSYYELSDSRPISQQIRQWRLKGVRTNYLELDSLPGDSPVHAAPDINNSTSMLRRKKSDII